MSSLELLESRIAPAALNILHPLPDIVAGLGKTSAVVDLGNMFNPAGTYHTFVTLHTNYDSDLNTAGIQGDITIELYDDTAPLTVQNFLSYVTAANKSGDYTGTFFNRLVSGFVLQGGSFNTNFTAAATHAPVHNEFGASNVAGTVAMAKNPVDPNSATDAFFFNLGDNTSTLDGQNGGFTVFGKVVDTASMNVVNAIAALTVHNLTPSNSNSPFTTVPTQGAYNADPDSNSATPPPVPTPEQLIAISGISVVAPLQATSPDITYTIQSIQDVSGQPTGLVTGKLSGQTLSLAYRHGGSGIAKVTVLATDSMGDSATDDFLVKVQPNLAVTLTENLSGYIVPGDHGLAKVNVTNNTAGAAVGRFDVKLFLVPSGSTTGAQIGTLLNVPLNLASGASRALSVGLEVPEALSTNQGAVYTVMASVTPVAGSTFTELFTDDDSNNSHVGHTLYNAFGTFSTPSGLRTNVALTYLDAAQHKVTMTLNGGGFGQVNVVAVDATHTATDLSMSGTTGASALNVRTVGGHTTLRDAYVAQSGANNAAQIAVGSVNMASVDLTGDFQAGGGLKSLSLGNLQPIDGQSHTVFIGLYSENVAQKAAVTIGNVTDYSFTANEAVSSLRVQSWLDVNTTTETVQSFYLDNFNVAGNFQADLITLTTSAVRSFTVSGSLQNASVHLGGGVNSVVLGGISASDFLVGATIVPASGGDFYVSDRVNSFRVIGSVQAGSHIAAAYFAQISVGQVDVTGSTAPFGFLAEQIGAYQRGTVKLTNLVSGTYDPVGTAPNTYRVTAF